ncbi:MAG TPA: hypothetical protein VE641_10530 [Chthoniobacterales bacterium]|jgi:hypothetical protein|nr:hypothetical protein [Chthoniobacterales bacterium]
MKPLIAEFVVNKKAWRKTEAHRPMSEKVEIINKLRERSISFRRARTLRKAA